MTVAARWEWRSFGADFGSAESRFSSLSPERVEDSDEVYLLAVDSDASVKVRGGLMDVKHLLRENEDGLEQWTPVLKAQFPLTAANVRFLLATLRVAGPPRSASFTRRASSSSCSARGCWPSTCTSAGGDTRSAAAWRSSPISRRMGARRARSRSSRRILRV